jgi:hypothetical protein
MGSGRRPPPEAEGAGNGAASFDLGMRGDTRRRYLRYALSYRDVEKLLRERGVWVAHTTIFRWVQRYAPELDIQCRPLLATTNDSYRVDELYIKIKKQRSCRPHAR